MRYDYLVVGAGLFGATFAREVTDAGKRVLVIEKRDHVAGNAYTYEQDDILIHKYGGHFFHTNSDDVWAFVNRFADWWGYQHRVKVNYHGRVYSFPINLMTLHQLYGISDPHQAQQHLAQYQNGHRPDNVRDWCLHNIGPELYEIFVEGYTTKQWGRPPEELPASIIRRIPVRTTYDDGYFSDRYQGLPVGGYTPMVRRMLEGINVQTGVDYFEERHFWEGQAEQVVYSGPLDRLFDYSAGHLEYRSLRWEYERHERDYQGCATMNYTAGDVPYTRILEFRHCMPSPPRHSIIAREYPQEWQPGAEPYYPINDDRNERRAKRYKEMAEQAGIILGGRLGTYRYYNMDQVIAQARAMAAREVQRA